MAMIYPNDAVWLDLSKKEGSERTFCGYYLFTEATPNSRFNSIHHAFRDKETGVVTNVSGATALNSQIERLGAKMNIRGLLMEVTFMGMSKSKSGAEYKDFRIGYDEDDRLNDAASEPEDSTPQVEKPAEAQSKSVPAAPAAKAPKGTPPPSFGEDDDDAPF